MTLGNWILSALVKLGSRIKLPKNILTNPRINLLNDNNNNSLINVDKRTQIINFNLGNQSPENIKEILADLPKIVDEGSPVLESKSTEKAEDYLTRIDGPENQKIIEYYTGKLPSIDITILKASLYLRSVLKSGGETLDIKGDITRSFGTRGRNISNLCTAGYFETIIKDLYEALSKNQDFTNEIFLKEYNFIVETYPFAVFVNVSMNEAEVKSTILDKIKWNKTYGHHELNIHGIGNSNINKIGNVLKEIEQDKTLTIKDKTVSIEKGIIVVKLVF